MAKTKKLFILEIEVDENTVADKYPNYRFNYDNSEQLIQSVANDVRFVAGVDMSVEGMDKWGYSIKVKEVD